ncbi:MAG: hypothetical protein QNI90_02080 [Dinoroseobacter sp.]|nr:hypothetical protein [Dinoroseobacter sp.]
MTLNPLVSDPEVLPFFVNAPGANDYLHIVVAAFLIVAILGFGVAYAAIQNIPEKMASGADKVQMQLVSLLGLLSLLTFNHSFWVAALLLAVIPVGDLLNKSGRSTKAIARDNRSEVHRDD